MPFAHKKYKESEEMKLHDSKNFIVLLITYFIFGCLVCIQGQNQKQNKLVSSENHSEIYRKLLDILFLQDVLTREDIRFAFLLRFKPSFEAESQIIIVEYSDGHKEVISQVSQNGNIWQKLMDMIFEGENIKDLVEVSKKFQVRTRSVKASSSQIIGWRRTFLDVVCVQAMDEKKSTRLVPSNEIIAQADGTIYQLWYIGERNVRYEFTSPYQRKVTDKERHPFEVWMKNVAKAVEKLPSISK